MEQAWGATGIVTDSSVGDSCSSFWLGSGAGAPQAHSTVARCLGIGIGRQAWQVGPSAYTVAGMLNWTGSA